VQSAFGAGTPIDAELAVDGIDEVLVMMLAGDWSDNPQPGSSGAAVVATDEEAWQVVMSPDEIMVGDVTGEPDVRVTGEPSNLLLWLWGRAPESAIEVAGDLAVARRLRHHLALATQ